MTENDLFGAADVPDDMTRPLAVRMRPRTVDEVLGQSHVLGKGSPLRRLANPSSKGSLTAPSSIIMFGPPGVGKTTLATIGARQSGRAFEELSAVTSGVKDVRDVLARARRRLVGDGTETVLFIDEVHRFSKSQQDALLPAVENRDVTFIGATTENPSFSVIKPLLSRSVVVKLESLEPPDLATLIARAVEDKRGLNGEVKIDDAAVNEIIRMAGGDARKTLTILEAAAGAVTGDKARKKGARRPTITPDVVSQVMDAATVRYDKDGDDHYDVISAFIKSMRGSDPDAAIHYLARMLRAGEDPRFIARRIMIAASEEVGMAAPQILPVTGPPAQAVALPGLPAPRTHPTRATTARPRLARRDTVGLEHRGDLVQSEAAVGRGVLGGAVAILGSPHVGFAEVVIVVVVVAVVVAVVAVVAAVVVGQGHDAHAAGAAAHAARPADPRPGLPCHRARGQPRPP